jgi:D-ribulokinase
MRCILAGLTPVLPATAKAHATMVGWVTALAIIITFVLTVSQVFVIETSALATTATPLSPLGTRTTITAAGVDLGTSGARLSIVEIEQPDDDPSSRSRAAVVERLSAAVPWTDGRYDDPTAWVAAVTTLLRQAAASTANNVDVAAIQSLCISGTSASCLIVDSSQSMKVVQSPRMYDYAVSGSGPIIDVLHSHAPARHTTLSPTSSLSKLLDWHLRTPLMSHHRLVHQADYVIQSLLADRSETYYCSDWHNCLKLGYDVRRLEWPPWLLECLDACNLDRQALPARVVPPGTAIFVVDPTWAASLGLSPSCLLTAGTTDSNAAFLAAAAQLGGGGGGGTMEVGVAVTSLGSTMAIKQLSAVYVEDSTRGIYSHRFPTTIMMMQIDDDQAADQTVEKKELWLVGGASNVGCAVLRQQNFTNDELTERSNDIDPDTDSPLQYYPLTKKGERFPTADPYKPPVLTPVPNNDRTAFLHGILQGISTVERDGYMALVALGASPPSTILTAGGGARNPTWTAMRRRILRATFPQVQVDVAVHTEASFGAALLAAGAARRKELIRTKTT